MGSASQRSHARRHRAASSCHVADALAKLDLSIAGLWLGRAHSIGHARQHLNLLGYALMVNGLALHRHQRRRTQLAA
jgi:hypothetical protein